ncbi:type IV pilin protein [Neisseria bacilliformis]|uniref:type IV pilin protein n=1 Tax=Neisseria bacilliformis TaxID=267212 RepID=UPI0028E2B48C|nr:type IV pilin protein [Neisseria bacilliformis]
MKNKKQSGFTLIELMITVAVIAILAAIAYPSYDRFIRKTRLENARADLLENARRLERFYTRQKTFKDFDRTAGNLKNDNKYFNIAFVFNDNNPKLAEPDVGHYLLTATPKQSTNASEDRYMQLNDDGVVTVCTGSGAAKNCEMY